MWCNMSQREELGESKTQVEAWYHLKQPSWGLSRKFAESLLCYAVVVKVASCRWPAKQLP